MWLLKYFVYSNIEYMATDIFVNNFEYVRNMK